MAANTNILLLVLMLCATEREVFCDNKFPFQFAIPKIPSPKELIDQIIPPPPNTWFNSFMNIFSSRSRELEPDKKGEENGNWNFFGRDIANRVTTLFKDVDDFTGFSNFTAGLDANLPHIPVVGDVMKMFQDNLKAIVPGTQWCGDGDRARSFRDLGPFSKADYCCRGHDRCHDFIGAGDSKYGLKNTGLFTRSHCSCDEEFYECLKNTDTLVSSQIGFTYFTLLGPQCFKKEYPILKCILYSRGKCKEYELDTNGTKIYQWFDLNNF